MSIKVSDLLMLPLLHSGRLIGGIGGLSRQVRAVSFTDHPIVFSEEEYALTKKGDLYICSAYAFRGEEEKLLERLRFYIQTLSSCCIIMVENYNEIPLSVIELANQNNYPVILLLDSIPYAEVIKTISEEIFLHETAADFEKRVNSLLYDDLTLEEVSRLARHFHSFANNGYFVCFIKFMDGMLSMDDLKRELESRLKQREVNIHQYKRQYFAVIGTDSPEELLSVSGIVRTSLEHICNGCRIGISAVHSRSSEFAYAMQEAFQSCRIGVYQGNAVTYFGENAFHTMLYALRHNPALSHYCQHILGPLREYEEEQGINLIETLRVFFQCDGNYKMTASKLYQHENTVRFRVAKAKSLLGMEKQNCRFIEEVSFAINSSLFLREID